MYKRNAVISFLILICFLFTGYDSFAWETVTSDGFGNADNVALYPGGSFNGNFFVGSGNNTSGGGLWRTSTGSSWENITANGFGDSGNWDVHAMPQPYSGALYAYTYNQVAGTELWSSNTGAPGTWAQVSVNGNLNALDGVGENWGIWGPVQRSGVLWFGTENSGTSCEIWYYNGSSWVMDARGSIAFSCGTNYIASLGVFNGYVYCGTFDDFCGAGLWRSASPWNPITEDGFGDTNNWQIIVSHTAFNGYLYAGTLNNTSGAEVWRSSDGGVGTWTQCNTDGFGLGNENWEITSFAIPGDGYIYAATSNFVSGAQIWRSSDGTTWEQINTSGFGDSTNDSIYLSQESFGSYLYAGTARSGGAQLYKMLLTFPGSEEEDVVVEEPGEIAIIGSAERQGVINPDKGDSAQIQFKGTEAGKYTLRIFTVLGELVYEETKDSAPEGSFSWIPGDIASGTYIVSIEGPGVSIYKKLAILR